MGVKGFRFVSDLFQICFIVQAVMSRSKGHFRLSDMPKYGALLFSKLKTTAKMMWTEGTLMLILNVFVFVFALLSQLTAGKRDFDCYPLHKFYILTRHPLNCIKNMLGRKSN